MTIVSTIITVWGICLLGINWYFAAKERNAEREKRIKWEKKYWNIELELARYKRMYLKATELNYYYASNPTKAKVNVDKDLLDAVKRGMMAAHPDKGGKQEDFIRFNKVYNDLKNNKYN